MSKVTNIFKNNFQNIKGSITKKMFAITAVLFVTFLTVTLLSQRALFETMYYKQKENDIKSNVLKFSNTFNTAQDESDILQSIEQFQSEYNTSIAVLNMSNNVIIRFKTNSEVMDNKNAEILDYVVKALKSDDEILKKLLNSQQITISFVDSSEGVKYLASAVMENGVVIIGTTSLQQVKEAVGVIGLFYKYFYMGGLVVVVILVLIYSRFITKPLRKINGVAEKLSNLDFSEKCDVKNNDEIGNLGNTLNFLSSNLESSLTSLNAANKKLQEDINKERKLEAIRKEFVADVSHELKTPITLIKGYAEGIKDGVFLEGNLDDSLDVIIGESDKMGKLVKDMLQLSSMESGKEIVVFQPVSITEIIEGVVRKLHHQIEEKKVTVNMQLIEGIAMGDEFKIEQVVTNFMTNAVRHTNEGGTINIIMEESNGWLNMSFENTGSHIDGDDLEKIWDKFYKIDKSRNRKDGGTGLGLSIVKNIIELHHGKYKVENTENGVKFSFCLQKS